MIARNEATRIAYTTNEELYIRLVLNREFLRRVDYKLQIAFDNVNIGVPTMSLYLMC